MHMPFLYHLANPLDNSRITDLLLGGDKSYLASVYGENWTNQSTTNRARVDPELLAVVNFDYEFLAQILTPRLDLLCTPIALPQGGVQFVNYFRFFCRSR